MVAVDEHRFAATSPSPAPFKKVFLIDLDAVRDCGEVRKFELADLMNVADPHDLNGDGLPVFTFPYVTIENVLVLDARTLLVVNDNNFPYGGGRAAESPLLRDNDVQWLKVTVDPRSREVFSYQAMIVPANRVAVPAP